MTPDEFPIAPQFEPPAPPKPAPAPKPAEASPQQTRQTLSYLRGLLQNYGLIPKHKLGQNFLIDLNLLELIARTAELSSVDAVLEVGTGTGSLSALIAREAGCLFTVEIDADIQPIARRLIGPKPTVELFRGDALARKNELNPTMIQGWHALAEKHQATRFKLVANLPYVIATPLMTNLLLSETVLERMVVMVQWEIAERMRATPGTKDYNALSVLMQSLADVEVVRKVLPANFYPRPKVDSAIVLVRPNAEKRSQVGNVLTWRHFLRDLYVHRRKNLRQALTGWPTGPRDKTEVDRLLADLGIDGTLRSETLSVADHLRLRAAFAPEATP